MKRPGLVALRRGARGQFSSCPREAELAASASEPWCQAESGEALPSQLQPKRRPARRGGVNGSRGGVSGRGELGRVESLGCGDASGPLWRRECGQPGRCPTAVLAVKSPGSSSSLPAPWLRNPFLISRRRATLCNLSALCGLKAGVVPRESPTPDSGAPVLSLSSLRFLLCPASERSARTRRVLWGRC